MTDGTAARVAERIAAAEVQREALRAAVDETRRARLLTFTDDEHDPEGSTASLDQVRDSALLVRVEQTLAELRAAQDRVREGTYGICERCGQPISAARLEARPAARACVACASRPTR